MGGHAPNTPEDLNGDTARQVAWQLARHAIEQGYSAILAPTHFLESPKDPWFGVDLNLCSLLRSELDGFGHRAIDIFYSLALPMREFRCLESRRVFLQALRPLPIDELWLRVSGFGCDATGPAFEAYVEAARHLQQSGVPLVAERVGGVIGLALLAFNAVGGIEHGLTVGERFEIGYWTRKREGRGGNPKRVYIPRLDIHLSTDEAAQLFSARGAKARFGCRDTAICPHGIQDMLDRPRRYFALQRMNQVALLSGIPPTLRASEFVEQQVRPLTDDAVYAVALTPRNPKLRRRLRTNLSRLDRLRPVLGALAKQSATRSLAKLPPLRAVRESRRPDAPL